MGREAKSVIWPGHGMAQSATLEYSQLPPGDIGGLPDASTVSSILIGMVSRAAVATTTKLWRLHTGVVGV